MSLNQACDTGHANPPPPSASFLGPCLLRRVLRGLEVISVQKASEPWIDKKIISTTIGRKSQGKV